MLFYYIIIIYYTDKQPYVTDGQIIYTYEDCKTQYNYYF